MVCSLCKSVNVNKSTCPLALQNPTQSNWDKHPKAKKLAQQNTYKSTIKQYLNPYIKNMTLICKTTNTIRQIKDTTQIILSGNIIRNYDIKVTHPERINIKIQHNKATRTKLMEYLNMFCDVYIQLSIFKPNRVDYFTKPNDQTKRLLNVIKSLKALFIAFLINNIDPNGGTPTEIDPNKAIDNLIDNAYISQLENLFTTIPEIPSDIPSNTQTVNNNQTKKVKIPIKHT